MSVQVRADDQTFDAIVRLDTAREHEIYRNGGILSLELRRLATQAPS